ncbi:hypothetical protein PsorP6_005228 [Peronosclerospora sorghi]|uniref:Uncharacterized protein n=1 Tax=Peronosclerospora sorghi TaxID=230839 RepID=A0ACC0W2J9_9STRA|nr:hypothetical protein PsorP6_005228 [Peronosclerospora sorghi]
MSRWSLFLHGETKAVFDCSARKKITLELTRTALCEVTGWHVLKTRKSLIGIVSTHKCELLCVLCFKHREGIDRWN